MLKAIFSFVPGIFAPLGQACLILLLPKLLPKIPGRKELGNAKNRKSPSQRHQKPIGTMTSKIEQAEPDESQAHGHQEDDSVIAHQAGRVDRVGRSRPATSNHFIETFNIRFAAVFAGASEADLRRAIRAQGPPTGSAYGYGVGISMDEAFHDFIWFFYLFLAGTGGYDERAVKTLTDST